MHPAFRGEGEARVCANANGDDAGHRLHQRGLVDGADGPAHANGGVRWWRERCANGVHLRPHHLTALPNLPIYTHIYILFPPGSKVVRRKERCNCRVCAYHQTTFLIFEPYHLPYLLPSSARLTLPKAAAFAAAGVPSHHPLPTGFRQDRGDAHLLLPALSFARNAKRRRESVGCRDFDLAA